MVSPFLTGEQTEKQITANIWLLKKGIGIKSMDLCSKLKVQIFSWAGIELKPTNTNSRIHFLLCCILNGRFCHIMQPTCCTITSYTKLRLLLVLSLPAQNKDKSYYQAQFYPYMNIKLEEYFLGISILFSANRSILSCFLSCN